MREFLILWGKVAFGLAALAVFAVLCAVVMAAALGQWGPWWSGLAIFVAVSLIITCMASEL